MTTGLIFELEKLEKELDLLHQIAAPLLTPAGYRSLVAARWQLRGLARDNPRAVWRISEPVSTVFSSGEYMSDGRGEHTLRGHLTTTWDLTRHGRMVEVRDNVSTVVAWESDGRTVASYRMDISAVPGAPGCGLHTQIHNHPEWFPADLDVPRFPTFIPTVGGVLEFVLSELFQTRWTRLLAGHRLANSWRDLQQELWLNYLDWQRQIVGRSAVSPWTDLKANLCRDLTPHA